MANEVETKDIEESVIPMMKGALWGQIMFVKEILLTTTIRRNYDEIITLWTLCMKGAGCNMDAFGVLPKLVKEREKSEDTASSKIWMNIKRQSEPYRARNAQKKPATFSSEF